MNKDNSELPLERLALGELSPAEQAGLKDRLGDLEPRLAALHASNAEILAAHPPARVRAELERRLMPRERSRVAWLALPLAAAAVAAVMWWPDPVDEAPIVASRVVAEPGETRIKGQAPHLVLHRQEGEKAVQLAEPAQARAHDRLQVSYVAAGASHGVVLSIDGDGVVTLHHPASPESSTKLQQTGAVALPQSYELDAAPGFERFVLVTAATPLDPVRVLAAAHALATSPAARSAPLTLPPSWQQHSFLISKVAP